MLYDLESEEWIVPTLDGAPVGLEHATVVWTGQEFIIWSEPEDDTADLVIFGYNPAEDVWRQLLQPPVSLGARDITPIWTGSELVVWGGRRGETLLSAQLGVGARYSPTSNSWNQMSSVGAPRARSGHAVAWTGSEFLVWGGADNGTSLHQVTGDSVEGPAEPSFLGDGRAYDPASDTWREIPLNGAPRAQGWPEYELGQHPLRRSIFVAGFFVLLGGVSGWDGAYETGGVFDTATWTWTGSGALPRGVDSVIDVIPGDRSVVVRATDRTDLLHVEGWGWTGSEECLPGDFEHWLDLGDHFGAMSKNNLYLGLEVPDE